VPSRLWGLFTARAQRAVGDGLVTFVQKVVVGGDVENLLASEDFKHFGDLVKGFIDVWPRNQIELHRIEDLLLVKELTRFLSVGLESNERARIGC
jgi:hypothetical protein